MWILPFLSRFSPFVAVRSHSHSWESHKGSNEYAFQLNTIIDPRIYAHFWNRGDEPINLLFQAEIYCAFYLRSCCYSNFMTLWCVTRFPDSMTFVYHLRAFGCEDAVWALHSPNVLLASGCFYCKIVISTHHGSRVK